MPDGSNMRGGMRGMPSGGMPRGGVDRGGMPRGGVDRGGMPRGGMPNFRPRRFPRFFFFPIYNGFPPGCAYFDRFGRCCDAYGRCCDQFGRCSYDDYYSGSGYPMMADMNPADSRYITPVNTEMIPGTGNTGHNGNRQY